MQDLAQLNELIAKATAIAGNQAKLAKLLDAKAQHVTNWKTGVRACSPEDIALMASIAGMDAEQWLVRATIQKHEGTAKGDKLLRALGKAWRATGEAAISAGVAAMATFLIHWGEIAHSTMYIM
jgi:hypothetical protein